MTDCETAISNVEISRTDLKSENYNKFNKQKRKKHKHKLAEAENMPQTIIMETNKALNCIVQHESMGNKLPRSGNENSRKKKVTVYEIIESATAEKSDNNVNSNKVHKRKRKHKFNNDENVSDCRILEMDIQDLENNTSIEIPKELNQHRKNHKHKSLGEMENVSNYRIKESGKAENNRILDELYKQKRHQKQTEFDNMSDYLSTDLNVVELSQNNFNGTIFSGVHKQKRKKRHKLVAAENLPKTADMESNPISNNTAYHEGAEESIIKNLDGQSVSKLSRKNNSHFETKAENHKKKKYKSTIDTNEFDCKIVEPAATEKSDIYVNSNKFHKKKRKHKATDDQNVSECRIAETAMQELENDTNIEFLKGLRRQKRKKDKHKLLGEMENVFNYQESATDESGKNRILGVFEVHNREDKHKQIEVDKISDCKTSELNAIEINQNDLNNENVRGFHKEKKNKHKHKLLDEMENRSDCKTAESDATEINRNDLSNGTFNGLHKAKRRKHRHNSAKVENMPKTVIESNNVRCHERTKENREKSIVQNSVADILPRLNKEHVESRIEMLSNNLQEKEKNVSCKGTEKNYQEFEDAYMSFDLFINDISEEPVPFLVPLLHEGERVASITAERRAYLEKNGVTVHTGKWTKTEDDILTRNFQQFCLEFRINNPFQLLGINQNKKDAEIIKFKRAKHFLVRLGKDLNNRPLRSIYMRARKLLTPLKNKKKLSAEETADLKHAHQLVGNKWTRISDMLSRSDSTCHTAFRWHKSDINKGKWTPEEESNLIKAIKTVSGAEDISANNLKNISWKAVEKYVPTRNEFQCQKYWAGHLAWDTSVTERKCWEKYHYGKLIYLLKEKYCFNSECEIDWRELHKHFNDVAASYIYLHKKWFYLKSKLPKGFDLSYSKQLDAFKKMYEEEYKIFADEKL